jgi:hypothetical protein
MTQKFQSNVNEMKLKLNSDVAYCFTKWCDGLMVKTLVWNKGD